MGISTNILSEKDVKYLRQAINVSGEARKHGNHPFGCVIVDEHDKEVTITENRVPSADATQHAELCAVSTITKIRDAESLLKCTLYSSTEPCAMCFGAIFWSGIGRIVFGFSNANLVRLAQLNPKNFYLRVSSKEIAKSASRPIEVLGPFLEDEAAIPHSHYWD
ncbi:cytosine deaminase [Schizosaccharomyces octosporus yFS286]|uniref:Cytosine deaminase n=1 Tax=Schizosaccharomyces octosporus (strain yFS286) TaxID=483514 RepID=S9Q5M7_SCHOY|nr:cytosine deaminase [Schizosaccharomyces octosporus yFS286]EPX75372.1 cytosine deaminase [Schizosaccharomyces octosporus yFS286]